MESDEYESDLDEFLDSLPAHLRTKALRKAYGGEDERIEQEAKVPEREPFTPGENALWWLLLPFAVAASLTLVALSVLAAALLLLPVTLMLWAAATVPIGSMVVWRMGGSKRVTT